MNKKEKSKTSDYSKYYPLFFTCIFFIVLFHQSFYSLESWLYDLRVKSDIGMSFENNIVLVTMDEESDEFLGDYYPYSYATHDRLLKRLIIDKPSVINYIVDFKSVVSKKENSNLNNFKDTLENYLKNDGSFRIGVDSSTGRRLPPLELREYGHSMANIEVDDSDFAKDSILRKAIIDIAGESSMHLWTANEYRKKSGLSELSHKSILGEFYKRDSDATFVNFRYYTSPVEVGSRISRIPFHRVVVGNFPKGFFTNKIVLIGPSYISRKLDYILTPFNQDEYISSKLTIHAEIIQAMVQNKTVVKVPVIFSLIISVILAIILSFTISRVRPSNALIITISLGCGFVIIAYILFVLFGMWIYMSHIILSILAVYYIWVPFRAIVEYQRRYAIQEEAILLKKVENLKQNFISLMSHDLKTPVAKIAGMADVMIQQNRSDEKISSGLQMILDSTKELNKFITSILDLTKVESRNVIVNKMSKDINKIIEDSIKNLKYESLQKKISIKADLGPLYPIEIDMQLMHRVISNLIENAIKYSGENSEVIVKSWDDENWVYITIADNGVGIPSQDLEHIFDKFYRVKNDSVHKIKGSGLGLYLVKYFVELHGGEIIAKSELNSGTEFQIKLINS